MSALTLDLVPPENVNAANDNPDTRATSFQAVEGGPETHSGANLLVSAYAVLWVILMAWLLLLWRKQANLHAKIDDLEKTLDRAAAKLEKK